MVKKPNTSSETTKIKKQTIKTTPSVHTESKKARLIDMLRQNDGITIDPAAFEVRVDGDRVALVVPKSNLPLPAFGMWVSSHTGLATGWDPFTLHPWTLREDFSF